MVHSTWAIVLASDKLTEIQPGVSACFLNLNNRPVLSYVLQAFEQCPDIAGVSVVAEKPKVDSVIGMARLFGFSKVKSVVPAAATRQGCVLAALKELEPDVTLVCIHEATRPCVTAALVSEVVKAAKRYGCAVPAVRLDDPVKIVQRGQLVEASYGPEVVWVAQTPQCFRRDLLSKGYALAARKRVKVSDDAEAYALTRHEVHIVPGSPTNLRIKTPADLERVSSILAAG